MIAGAIAISMAEAPTSERAEWRAAMTRECDRYGLDPAKVEAALRGEDPLAAGKGHRRAWEYLVAAAAVALFVWLASFAERPRIHIDGAWALTLSAVTALAIVLSGVLLYRRTRFS